MPSPFGFHGFLPPLSSTAEAIEGVERAAAKVGLERVASREGQWPLVEYGRVGLKGLGISLDPRGVWWQLGLYPVHRETFDLYGAELIGALLQEACIGLKVILGRSFKEDGHAIAKEAEIGGPVEYIEWLQFFGPSIVARWGLDCLQKGPFYRVKQCPDGSCAIWLWETPYDQAEAETTKRAAEYLGIKLRPHFIRDSKGNLVQLNWP
jgi:hypothetical protein